MYTLKQIPEDFIVTERSNIVPEESGRYLYCRLIKKNWNTLDVIKRLGQILGIKEKQIGFAGSKDKNAVTEQVISFLNVSKAQIERVKLNDVELHYLGYGKNPISLGDLEGNHFVIVVRNLDLVDNVHSEQIKFIPNYFDEQRFGSMASVQNNRKINNSYACHIPANDTNKMTNISFAPYNNALIGKCFVKKDFAQALKLINDRNCQRHLQQYPHDSVGALKLLPSRLLRLYLNSYQSYLWNETLASYLKQKGGVVKEVAYSSGKLIFTTEIFPELEIPLVGFGGEELKLDPEVQRILFTLMKKEELTFDDFIIKQIPELTLEGEMRKAFVEVKSFKIDVLERDELNLGKQKVRLTFDLPKGSYATMVVKRIMDMFATNSLSSI